MNWKPELEARLKKLFLELLDQNSDCLDGAEEIICGTWENAIYTHREMARQKPIPRLVTNNVADVITLDPL
ncbi:hypothetical protein K2X33_03365 [bacterium]|nr:hypothetical protein [bacterium]